MTYRLASQSDAASLCRPDASQWRVVTRDSKFVFLKVNGASASVETPMDKEKLVASIT